MNNKEKSYVVNKLFAIKARLLSNNYSNNDIRDYINHMMDVIESEEII